MNESSALRAPESLLLGSGQQIDLIELDDAGLPAQAYQSLEARGRFTGERLFSSNPKLYTVIVRLLGRGMTYRAIAEVCEVSENTVCGVSFREQIPIEALRERMGRLGLDVSQLTLEAILELLVDPAARKKISAKDLAIIHGIATTNAQLLLGGATSRVETPQPLKPTHATYLELIQTVTATGSGAETAETKEAAPAPGPEPEPPATPGPDTPPEQLR